MGDKSPKDITSGSPEAPSSLTESFPSANKPPKLGKRRKSRKHSNASTVDPPQDQEDPTESPEQGAPAIEENQQQESNPLAESAATPREDDKNNSQEQPHATKSKMSAPTDELSGLTKDVGEKAAPAKGAVKEITTGGMDMRIDDEDLNWKSSEKEGSLQIRVRINLRAKVQLNLDARVKGEVVIGLL
ncbi:hypothetical protein BO78DRAFT_432932 [Aspergillus sclerotiicarbonarius CBS 121057]|uniref:Uncharacterized protein n=1 Tax=Aspergillus sclerotiicarbonarius (strain CBS 121057 / IBT 28362) TaxID=1448318 RepID=A0A319DWV6_ASPSB|nr:hypothetical protein BO78DRAFT_432932 [Aspergillus sclerotiicarbonarius CBS 121057]